MYVNFSNQRGVPFHVGGGIGFTLLVFTGGGLRVNRIPALIVSLTDGRLLTFREHLYEQNSIVIEGNYHLLCQ